MADDVLEATVNEGLVKQINHLFAMLRCEICNTPASALVANMKGPLCQDCFDWIFVEKHNEEFPRTFTSRTAFLARKQAQEAKSL